MILEPEPEGGYTVTVPGLPGCISYGSTHEEAVEMIKEAIQGYLESMAAHKQSLPTPVRREYDRVKIAA